MAPLTQTDDDCGRGAHYIEIDDRCECKNPDTDGKRMYPDKYRLVEYGMVCYYCEQKHGESKSIMFILDSSGSVGAEGWTQLLKFMEKVINSIDKVRTGAIILADVPVVDLQIGEHSRDELRTWMQEHSEWLEAWTRVGYSLHLAREALLVTNFRSTLQILMLNVK
ncbi:hypothetical protein OSTOST_01716 [Ostertagia ostertagi]